MSAGEVAVVAVADAIADRPGGTAFGVLVHAVLALAEFDASTAALHDLAMIHQINDDISSEGSVALNASVKGAVSQPAINGRLELKNAAFQTAPVWP